MKKTKKRKFNEEFMQEIENHYRLGEMRGLHLGIKNERRDYKTMPIFYKN